MSDVDPRGGDEVAAGSDEGAWSEPPDLADAPLAPRAGWGAAVAAEEPAGQAMAEPAGEPAMAEPAGEPAEQSRAEWAQEAASAEPAGQPVVADSVSHSSRWPRRRGLPALALPIVLAVLAAAVSAAAIVQVLRVQHAQAVAKAQLEAVVAARTAVTAVLSYDYHNLTSDFASAERLLTPSFRRDYATTTKALIPTAKKYQAVVSAQVTAAGVTTATASSANVLLFVDQVSTNSKHAQPRTDQSRVRATMVRQGGRWLLSDISAL